MNVFSFLRRDVLSLALLLFTALVAYPASAGKTISKNIEDNYNKGGCWVCGERVNKLGTIHSQTDAASSGQANEAPWDTLGPITLEDSDTNEDHYVIKLMWGKSDYQDGEDFILVFIQDGEYVENEKDGWYYSSHTNARIYVDNGSIDKYVWNNDWQTTSSSVTHAGITTITYTDYFDGILQNTTVFLKDDITGEMQLVSRSSGDSMTSYTYDTSNPDRITKIDHKRGTTTNGYTYYRYADANGMMARKITINVEDIDGALMAIRTGIEVYHTTGNDAGRLHFRLNPDQVNAFLADSGVVGINPDVANDGPIDEDTDLDDLADLAEDSDLKPYATYIVEDYDTEGRITLVSSDGSCACGSGDAGTLSYVYETNGKYPTTPTDTERYNTWYTYVGMENADTDLRTVEYKNKLGQTVVSVVQEMSGTTVVNRWVTHTIRDDEGRVVERRMPSACTGYSFHDSDPADGWPDAPESTDTYESYTTDENGTTGMVHLTAYDTNDNVTERRIREGSKDNNAIEYLVSSNTYTSTTYNGYTVYRLASTSVYPTLTTSTSATDKRTTSYSYTYYQDGGSDTHAVEYKTETRPTVSSGNNGPGVAATQKWHYKQDTTNNLYYNDWSVDAAGSLTYRELNTDGLMIKTIRDVDTDQTGDFSAKPSGSEWTNADGAHLITTYAYDSYDRRESTTGPDGVKTVYARSVMRTNTAAAGGNPEHERTDAMVSLSVPHMDGTDYSELPVSISVSDMAGRVLYSAQGDSSDDTDGDLADDWNSSEDSLVSAFSGTIVARTDSFYNDDDQLEKTHVYHDFTGVTSSDDGDLGTNFYRTYYRYDYAGRQIRAIQVVSGTTAANSVEQLTKTDYDQRGRAIATYVAVSDASQDLGSTYSSETGITFTKISEAFYDESTPGSGTSGVGDGRLTSSRSYHGTGASEYTTIKRYYDYRGRMRGSEGAAGPFAVTDYDNMGRSIASAVYDTAPTWATVLGDEDYAASVTTDRRGLSKTYYDERGQAYKSEVYEVAESDGSATDKLITNYYYDLAGRQVASTSSGGGASETAYDTMGRAYQSRLVTELEATKYDGSGNYQYRAPEPDVDLTAMTGGDDKVLSISHSVYSDGSGGGRMIGSHSLSANHDDTDGLDASTDDDYIQSTTYVWHDAVGRTTNTAAYGTNATSYTYASLPTRLSTPPARSDTILVTTITYDSATGRQDTVTDPAGIVTKTFYDDMGRPTHTVENYDAAKLTGGEPDTPAVRNADVNRITKTVYNGLSQTTEQIAIDPDHDGTTTDNQTTTYLYEDTRNASLVTNTIMPDSADTTSTGTDQIKIAYHVNGQVDTTTDQRGNVMTHAYDSARRLKAQQVTTLDTDTDGEVRSITRGYDAMGRIVKITSHGNVTDDPDNITDVINQIVYEFDDFGALVKEYQEHDGVKDGNSHYIKYGHDDSVTSDEFTAGYRRDQMTLPNGRVIHTRYGTSGSIDDILSRATALVEDNGTTADELDGSDTDIVAYSYTGGGMMVLKDLPTPDIQLDYFGGTSGTYAGFDRFGRVTAQQWVDYSAGAGNEADVFHIQHGYDRASNRLYAHRQVYPSHSEGYTHDGLHRLENFDAGKIKSDQSGIEDYWVTRSQHFTLDQMGNPIEVDEYANSSTADPFTEITGLSKANEIESIKIHGERPKPALLVDDFTSDTSANYEISDEDGDAFSINTTNGELQITNLGTDGETVLLIGEEIGMHAAYTVPVFPDETGGEAGYVFGYTSPGNYYLAVADTANNRRKFYHVVNGTRTQIKSTYVSMGTSDLIQFLGMINGGIQQTWTYRWLSDGFPTGRVGLYTSQANVKFTSIAVWSDVRRPALAGRWTPRGQAFDSDEQNRILTSEDALRVSSWVSGHASSPTMLEGIRARRFEVTFKATGNNQWATTYFAFNSRQLQHFHAFRTRLHNSGDEFWSVWGNKSTVSSSGSGNPWTNSTKWLRITHDGTTVSAKARTGASEPSEGDWSSTSVMRSTTNINDQGGILGFGSDEYHMDIDHVTIKTDRDENGSFETTEYEDNFTLDANGYREEDLEHDAAGNLTYDGRFAYTYDAWNRMVKAQIAYREPSTGDLKKRSVISVSEYDGQGRRIVKAIQNAADLDMTTHFYYDGQSIIEERDGSDNVIRQIVWGLAYIDELVQNALNDDPDDLTEQNVETFYYALHNAQFNVLGLVDDGGGLVERYEYTPYGQRQVFTYAGTSDPYCMVPMLMGHRHWTTTEQPYARNPYGHQGLYHDEETELIYNRARMLHPRLARFTQRDPLGYIAGINLYTAYHILWQKLDPSGNRPDDDLMLYRQPNGSLRDNAESRQALINKHGVKYVVDLENEADYNEKLKLVEFEEFVISRRGEVRKNYRNQFPTAGSITGYDPYAQGADDYADDVVAKSLRELAATLYMQEAEAACGEITVEIVTQSWDKAWQDVPRSNLEQEQFYQEYPEIRPPMLAGGKPVGYKPRPLFGASIRTISKTIPRGWQRMKADSGKGVKWVDEKGVERIRFMRPLRSNDRGILWERQKFGYWRWRNSKGEWLDEFGNVIPGQLNNPDFPHLSHIPYSGR